MLVAHQWKVVSSNDPVPLFLDLKAEIQVQVPIETEALPHQANPMEKRAVEALTVGLHSIGIAGSHLVVEVVHVVGAYSPWSDDADGLVFQPSVDGS